MNDSLRNGPRFSGILDGIFHVFREGHKPCRNVGIPCPIDKLCKGTYFTGYLMSAHPRNHLSALHLSIPHCLEEGKQTPPKIPNF